MRQPLPEAPHLPYGRSMKQSLRYNLVDVFTDTPLQGNPLAVFTRAKGLSSETMQAIAREMNLSETVFLLPPEQGGHARIRIFTPLVELPFAGHPVLGSAWVMGQPMEMGQLRLETGAGVIAVDLFREGDRLQLAQMTQPIPSFVPFERASELYAALGATTPDSALPLVEANNGPRHVFAEVASTEILDGLKPDYSRLAQLAHAGIGVFHQEGEMCALRYFAPAFGINEDPATGSAAGPLGAYLVQKGRLASGATLTVRQGVAMGRPSLLQVNAHCSNEKIERVQVAGAAVVVGRGELLV